ncbi:MAG: hypothetical protein A3F72_16000 [Bacteroidetes bacterium RIFCSPLOWO2_12_FULL_35_15]|nr:MAG: hypothetical protein A3F72_16000 [Bacteroidetes bacterium RIFCSPLOWO2_12_FULL_35_15]
MEKRNYPSKRKSAGMWECPICNKSLNIRGKSGHLKLVHNQTIPPKEHDPLSTLKRNIAPKKRPLAKADVRNLLSNIKYLTSYEKPNDLLSKRKTYLQCEFLIRELEINFRCTLEDALNKFPEIKLSSNF